MRNVLLLFFTAFAMTAAGQTHQWAFDIQPGANGLANITCLTVDDSSNVYVGGIFYDTLYFGKDTLYFRNGNVRAIFLAKYTSDGKFIWVRQLSAARGARLKQLAFTKAGELLLYGDYTTNGITGIEFGKFTLIRGSAVFLAWMDRDGTFTNARDIAYGYYCQAESMEIGPDGEVHAAMYLNGFGSGYRLINGNSTVSGSGYTYALAKYSSTANALRWHHFLSSGDVSGIYSISVDRHKQVYATVKANLNKTIFGTSVGSTNPNFLLWFRPDGTFHKKIQSASINAINRLSGVVALDSNRIYVAGSSRNDSFQLGNSKIYAPTSRPGSSFYFVAELENFDTLNWYVSSSQQNSGIEGDCRLSRNGDFLYFSSLLNSNGYTFGGFSTSGPVQSAVSKLDRLGNVLWYLPIPSGTPPILSPIGDQDLVYSGSFSKPVRLAPFNLPNKNSKEKPFLARTFDYSITRGPVRKGPYCAGDTLLVPFTRSGSFDTSNFFIAELSDVNGNFISNFRELGRLKAQTDTTIVGLLPLFKVVSSDKYRIRIRSTNPVVQSYYLLDTLKLLIYSTDKADPGPDLNICLGDTIQLETFGGTRWKWSPAYRMNDSTSRTPLVWPGVDTTYTIAISDSSGCGLPDTASLRVRVLDVPKFDPILMPDTIACFGESISFAAHLKGGSGSYFVWQLDANNRVLGEIPSDSNRVRFDFRFNNDTLIRMILTDSCSEHVDTLSFSVSLPLPSGFATPPDTLLCAGQGLNLNVGSSGFRVDSLSWLWIRQSDGAILSTDTSLQQVFYETDAIRVIRTDHCLNRADTGAFRVEVHPPIQTEIRGISPTDTFCYGETITMYASVSGGDPNAMRSNSWLIANKSFSGDTVRYATNSSAFSDSFQIQLISSDGCTVEADTVQFTAFTHPPLQLRWNGTTDSILCAREPVVLRATYSGGKPGSNMTYSWKSDRLLSNAGDSLVILYDSFSTGSNRISLTGNDGCSQGDTIMHLFTKPLPLSTTLSILPNRQPFCSYDTIRARANSVGGRAGNYQHSWWINDLPYSNADSIALTAAAQSATNPIKLRYLLEDACSRNVEDSVLVQVYPTTVVSIAQDSLQPGQQVVFELCQGEKIPIAPVVYYTKTSQDALPDWYLDGTYLGRAAQFEFDAPAGGTSKLLRIVTANTCSPMQDTLDIRLIGKPALRINLPSDTVICYGADLSLLPQLTGGKTNTYRVQWSDKSDPSFSLDQEKAELKNLIRPMQLQAVLQDSCSTPDTAGIMVNVLPALSADLTADSLCADGPFNLSASAKGGLPSGYTYTWQSNGITLPNTTSEITYKPKGIERISVILMDGCSPQGDTASVNIAPKPQFSLTGISPSACAPYLPRLDIQSLNGETLQYRLINETLNEQHPFPWPYALNAGTYFWKAKAENSLGCTDSILFQTEVKPKPSALFSFNPQKPELTYVEIQCLADAVDAEKYHWFLNGQLLGMERTFRTTPTVPGSYTIELRVEQNGCADSSVRNITVQDPIRYNAVNAFSPNNDGINDLYQPNLSGVNSYVFNIYNRWGQKVYSGTEARAWDGMYLGDPVQSGVYKVMIQVTNTSGRRTYYEEILHVLR